MTPSGSNTPAHYIHIPEADVQALRAGSATVDQLGLPPSPLLDVLRLLAAAVIAVDDASGRQGVHISFSYLTLPLTTPPLPGE